ncbi:hypothetical protein B0A50_07920 [Salinomyces thailandicus]|uniref:DUF1907 domain-containing protein n=1 Tax=Salinomyces thailandicus TaxID=706561 RepID=A0A4U0TKN6_9PEZI|nr:hypothetical protein B0A50_07920 [Salinomyces thailandica]
MAATRHPLSPPPLDELAKVLQRALEANYESASADVTTCPDLTQAPFHLASPGLSGDESAADIGGQAHLAPRPLLEKRYSLLECAKIMNMSEQRGMLIGAGAAPFHVIGQNAELAPNLSWQDDFENIKNLTHVTKVVERQPSDEAQVRCEKLDSTECALMMNLFGSSGATGPVLKITARARKGDEKSFSEFLRVALQREYGDEHQISLGGVFVMKRGNAVFHVMPDFPPEEQLPFKDREAVSDWLTFHDFVAPMVCLTVFHSADPEGLGLRMEHTHCFSSDKNQGGHYHYDVSPGQDGTEGEIEYEAYLNTAKVLYRIDMPQ